MLIEAHIPVKSYLKKYILSKYGYDTPLRINKTFGLGCLTIKAFSETNNRIKGVDFNDKLHIVFDHGEDLNLSSGNVFDFNSLLEDIYRKDLAMFISLDKLFNPYPERKQAIIIFNSNFGIGEEDISVETLIKHLQRHEEDTQIFDYKSYKKVS